MSRTLIPLSLLFRRLLCCVKKAQKLLAPPAWKQTTSSGNSHQRQILNVDFSVIRPLSIAYSTYPKLSLPRPLKHTNNSGTREKGPKKTLMHASDARSIQGAQFPDMNFRSLWHSTRKYTITHGASVNSKRTPYAQHASYRICVLLDLFFCVG